MPVVGQSKLCVSKLLYTLTSSREGCLTSRCLSARTPKPSAKMRRLSKVKVTDFSIRNLDIPLLHTFCNLFCGWRSSPQAFSSQRSAHALILRGSMAEELAFPLICVSPTNLPKPKLNLLPSLSPHHALWLVWPQPETVPEVLPNESHNMALQLRIGMNGLGLQMRNNSHLSQEEELHFTYVCGHVCTCAHPWDRPNFAYLQPKQTNFRQQVSRSTLRDVYKTHHSVLFSLAFLKVRALQ